MEVTRQTDYAVRTMVYLAGLPLGRRVPTATISQTQGVPQPFLSKVISRLAMAGLVITSRGMGGGVTLARMPGQITLLQVVEAVDGPVRLNSCLLRPGSCDREAHCAAHDAWADIQAHLIRELSAVTMEELARREAAKAGSDT